MRYLLLVAILIVEVSLPALQASVAMPGDNEVRIALRANRGIEEGMARWQATADYLTAAVPGYHFVLVPFKQNAALNQEISQGGFHFVLTNPAASVEHAIRYNTKQIATLVNKRQGKGYMQFGSVIFSRADRKDINTLQDLKGKFFMGVDDIGFGGWRVAWLELMRNNINPFEDFKEVRFAGGIQQKVVHAVLNGDVDAGSVRTDMLEQMAEKNEIKLENFKVLGQKHQRDFPFLLSTQLYPEWAFSKTQIASNGLSVKVLQALQAIPVDSVAADQGRYVGWIKSLDYSSVKRLMEELAVGPYQRTNFDLWVHALKKYWLFLLLFTVLVVTVTTWINGLLRKKVNKQVSF